MIAFYDKVIVHEGKAVDVVFLDFSKTFDTVPSGQVVQPRDEQDHSALGEEPPEAQSSNSCSEGATSGQWRSSGFKSGASSVQ